MDGTAEVIFGHRVAELLDERNLLQVDLAKHLNVTKTTVSRYCRGRVPDAATLDRIARFFDVSVDYLLGRAEDRHGQAREGEPARGVDQPARDLFFFLRGKSLTPEDVEAVKDLLEARRLRREREERDRSQP